MRHMSSKKPFKKADLKPLMSEVKSILTPTPAAESEQALAPVDPLAPVTLSLAQDDAMKVQLAHERLQNASLHLQNRRAEFEALVGQVRAKYEEGSKYTMSSINLDNATIVRALRVTVPQ